MRHLAASTWADQGHADQVFPATVFSTCISLLFIYLQINPVRQALKPMNGPNVKPMNGPELKSPKDEPKEEPEGRFITVNSERQGYKLF